MSWPCTCGDLLMFILHLNDEPQHCLQNQLKCARILIPVRQNNPSHAQTLTNPPPTPAVAHFIINDLWLGVRAVTASVKTVVHSKKKLNSYNTDKRHIKTRALVSYQLNLVSFDNFHNCICLTHLLHPLLLSLCQCSFFFSPRHQKHTLLSLSGTAAPVLWDWPRQHRSRLSSTSSPHQTWVNFPLSGLSACFPLAQIALIPLSLLPSCPPSALVHLPLSVCECLVNKLNSNCW